MKTDLFSFFAIVPSSSNNYWTPLSFSGSVIYLAGFQLLLPLNICLSFVVMFLAIQSSDPFLCSPCCQLFFSLARMSAPFTLFELFFPFKGCSSLFLMASLVCDFSHASIFFDLFVPFLTWSSHSILASINLPLNSFQASERDCALSILPFSSLLMSLLMLSILKWNMIILDFQNNKWYKCGSERVWTDGELFSPFVCLNKNQLGACSYSPLQNLWLNTLMSFLVDS